MYTLDFWWREKIDFMIKNLYGLHFNAIFQVND